MEGPDENQINLKKEIIKAEIIDKNYDKDKFIEFCLSQKENGDDLSNWSLLELNDIISQFIKTQHTEETQNTEKKGPEVQKEEIEKVLTAESQSQIQENEIEITCKKLEKSPINDKDIKVEIRNPKTNDKTFLQSAYVTYEVVTEAMQWLVRRRYSDFEWLRTILVKCYPRLVVPPLPGKKIGGRRFEDDFIKKRMAFLQKFIDIVLSIEEFKACEGLIAFLSMIDRGQFDAKMKELTTFTPSTYVQDMKTLSGKITVTYNESHEKYYNNISTYFRLQNQLFERLNYNLKNYYTNASEACLNLVEVQKDFETLTLLNSRIGMKSEITKTFEELGIFFKNWKRIIFNQNEVIKTNIKDFFKYRRMEGEAYFELIYSRENILQKYKEEYERVTHKKEKLWTSRDISKWEIIDEFHKVDQVLLVQDRDYAFSKMCTKDTKSLENIHMQLGYANKMNMQQLDQLTKANAERYVDIVKQFAEKFYPTLTDGITLWSTLTNYL